MAGQSFTGPIFIAVASATDVWFRTFKPISDALTAAGLPKTADSGQVDWTTATLPGAAVWTSYEIRRFSDAAQSSDPVVFRVDYGYRVVTTSQYPTIRITVGTGSNGSGTITGQSYQVESGLGSTSTVRTWRLVSDGAGFFLQSGVLSSAPGRTLMLLERLRGPAGTPLYKQLVFFTNKGDATNTSALFTGWITTLIDQEDATAYPGTGLPISYWKNINTVNTSLVFSNNYPFGQLILPTRYGAGRAKLVIGGATADFGDGAIIRVPRFTDAVEYRYFVSNPDPATGASFGAVPTDSTAPSSTTAPYFFAIPLMYWE